jgi:hypothetical protein
MDAKEFMEKTRLKVLIREIKSLLEELESEVYTENDSHNYMISDYDEVFNDCD